MERSDSTMARKRTKPQSIGKMCEIKAVKEVLTMGEVEGFEGKSQRTPAITAIPTVAATPPVAITAQSLAAQIVARIFTAVAIDSTKKGVEHNRSEEQVRRKASSKLVLIFPFYPLLFIIKI